MKRSKHSLSHYRLTSLNMGQLYPVAVEEVLPGDSFRHQVSALVRVSPLVAPVMHPCTLAVHSWFVPSRILWTNWEDFITGNNTALVTPVLNVNSTQTAAWKFVQAMGVGAESRTTDITLNALPFRAYNMIWNEFYRDQQLSTPLNVRIGDTGDVPSDYSIQNVSWEKDYFTSARPFPQQGSNTEVVALTLGGRAPVQGLGVSGATSATGGWTASDGSTFTGAAGGAWRGEVAGNVGVKQSATPGRPDVWADLSQLSPAGSVKMDINEWRKSMAMQRMREHRNRFGSRYRDMLAFLGVHSSDARLQRPEYLGGGRQTISFSEVLSTADTTTAVIGDMAGHGIAALRTRPYKRFFEEHGYILTLVFCRPMSVYQQRVPRHYLRRDWGSYWQKELEAMGEQAITNAEIYGDTATPSGVFGYIPRYDEYRHSESFVSGEFRTLLDYWHMARKFTAQPVLNGAFVSCDPTNRVYASATNDQLYAMIGHRMVARRLVSKFARN